MKSKLKESSLTDQYLIFFNRVECWAGPKFDAGTAEKVVIFDLFGSLIFESLEAAGRYLMVIFDI